MDEEERTISTPDFPSSGEGDYLNSRDICSPLSKFVAINEGEPTLGSGKLSAMDVANEFVKEFQTTVTEESSKLESFASSHLNEARNHSKALSALARLFSSAMRERRYASLPAPLSKASNFHFSVCCEEPPSKRQKRRCLLLSIKVSQKRSRFRSAKVRAWDCQRCHASNKTKKDRCGTCFLTRSDNDDENISYPNPKSTTE